MSLNDFVFLSQNKPLLTDDIMYLQTPNDSEFLITNDPNQKAIIYAKEINSYFNNSSQNDLEKAKNIEILYKARGILFDNNTSIPHTKKIGNKIALIDIDENTTKLLKDNGYMVVNLSKDMVKTAIGSIGELSIIVDEYELECDIILHNNADITPFSGIYDINNIDDILSFLSSISPKYTYSNIIDFNEHICQTHARREKVCSSCIDVCQNGALMIDDENKIITSQIDCNNCTECFSVCPTGALQSCEYLNESFFEVLELFVDKNIIIVDESNISLLDEINLLDFLPFVVPNISLLHKTHLLYIASMTNHAIITKPHKSIDLINKITNTCLNKQSISFLDQAITIKNGKKTLPNIAKTITTTNQVNAKLNSHELFAKQLAKIYALSPKTQTLKDSSFFNIRIDKQKCTLCMSCVGACNLGAIYADGKSGKIFTNDSLCVGCGYCVSSCAEENTLFVTNDATINDEFFTTKISAEDEAFACIECGKEFASKKAIFKIADMMKGKFSDPDKIKTLYCCTECKAKIMMMKLATQEMMI